MIRRSCLIIATLFIAQNGWGQIERPKGPAYLVYAGPYSTSPSSAFGHLFLVFRAHEGDPLPLWNVVSFTAETHDAGPIRFFFRGVGGGFLGIYKTLKFHQKTRDYEILEDRDLWLVELQLSAREREALEEAVSRVESKEFPYTFFCRNCAYYIQLLLSEALPAIPKPACLVSPVGVLKLVAGSGLAGPIYYRPAISQRLTQDARNLPTLTTRRLQQSDWQDLAADYEWLRGLTTAQRSFVQEFLFWKALHLNAPLSEASEGGLAQLRLLNARTEPGLFVAPTSNVPGHRQPFPHFHSYGKLTASSHVTSDGTTRTSIRYRPALHAVTDPWTGYRPVNTLEAMTVKISTGNRRRRLRLEEFILFSQFSLSPANWISANKSWILDISARRGDLFGPATLQFGMKVGLGQTRNVGRAGYAHLLVTGSVRASQGETLAVAPGFLVGATVIPRSKWRSGAWWEWQQDTIDRSRSHGRAGAWVRRDVGTCMGVTANIEASWRAYDFSVDLDWYFSAN